MKEKDTATALRTQSIFLIVLGTIPLVLAGLFILSTFFPHTPSPQASLLLDYLQPVLSPKPTERFLFLSSVIIIPIYAWFLVFICQLFNQVNYSKSQYFILPLVSTILLLLPMFHFEFYYLFLLHPIYKMNNTTVIIMGFSIATLWCLWETYSPSDRNFLLRQINLIFAWLIFISAVLLNILAWRIVSINSVSHDPIWTNHYNAAIYAISQVIAGKTILYDLPSQYGLFPELIAPLFKRIGGTVLNLSLFFAGLQMVSLLGLFFVLSKMLRSVALLILGGLTMLTLTFHTTLHLIGTVDPYFQYWPIRFFWPAISVPLFYFFLCKKTLLRSAIVSLTAAIGMIWVLDTGLFINLAFAAYLIIKSIILWLHTPPKPVRSLGHAKIYFLALILHLFLTLFVVSLFLLILTIKAHHPLNFFWLFEYQHIFYITGFALMPMPRELHPWMSVLGVYLVGIIAALTAWSSKTDRIRIDMILYLSLLGLGLFVYFEGRSHASTLEKVCWPAVMIIVVFADRILYRIRHEVLPKTQLFIPIGIIAFLLLFVFKFTTLSSTLFDSAKHSFLARHYVVEPLVQNEINFIKSHTQPKQACLILSQNQGIYYLETGLASPVRGPGFIETFFKSDLNHLNSELFAGKINCLFIGKGSSSIGIDDSKLTQIYNLIDENPEHTMVFLQPKQFKR